MAYLHGKTLGVRIIVAPTVDVTGRVGVGLLAVRSFTGTCKV